LIIYVLDELHFEEQKFLISRLLSIELKQMILLQVLQ